MQTSQDIQGRADLDRRFQALMLHNLEQTERLADADKRWPVLGSPWLLMAAVVVSMFVGVAIGLTAR